jgi:hypothetical protein
MAPQREWHRRMSDTADRSGHGRRPGEAGVHSEGPLTPTGLKVMVTGHRDVTHRALVAARLTSTLTKLEPAAAISGGAEGADTLFAQVALSLGVPLHLMIPNRWYLHRYPNAVDPAIIEQAAEASYVVERPDVDDWRQRWDRERWWVDNHARNGAMVQASELTVVVSPRAPRVLLGEHRGGTASCVREVLRRRGDGHRVIWVPDLPDRPVCWDTLRVAAVRSRPSGR